jgi:Fic family protein
MTYIWGCKKWPHFQWNNDELFAALGAARFSQGALLSKVQALGMHNNPETYAEVLMEETLKTAEIEGEKYNKDSVRSSVARHLGLSTVGLPAITKNIDGLVEMLLNATREFNKPLTASRLKSWQAALFPTGFSGLSKIKTGKWRGKEPMRVVSGPIGKEKIHFEAPPYEKVDSEMKAFLAWWKQSKDSMDGIIRAAIAHFYFVTIHPFEDGNGRIARALTDMALAQCENLGVRFYSLSSQIMKEREDYYSVLERVSKGTEDITIWLKWFLDCYKRAIDNTEIVISRVLDKSLFWQKHNEVVVNERQRKVLNKLLDAGKGGFEGGLTTRKYVGIGKTSRVTAYREITDLLDKKLLRQNEGKGRSASYDINWR